LVCGIAVAAFRLVITPPQARFFEFLVGCMLVYLGARVLVRLAKAPRLHVHAHEHDGVKHTHLHFHLNDQEHAHQHHTFQLGGRPFIVGAVHGLAGTAAVMLLVVGAIPSFVLAVGALLVFGLGSIGGMVLMSLLLSLPMALAARRLLFLERAVRLAAGLFSLGLGLFLAWNIGFLQALP